jgi:hypothetical protein
VRWNSGRAISALDIDHELVEIIIAVGHVANHSHIMETSERRFAPQRISLSVGDAHNQTT